VQSALDSGDRSDRPFGSASASSEPRTPVLLYDEIVAPALVDHIGYPIARRAARNYACDGDYETTVAGKTEFSFGFISALDLIRKSANRGAGVAAAGATNLRGTKIRSARSLPMKSNGFEVPGIRVST